MVQEVQCVKGGKGGPGGQGKSTVGKDRPGWARYPIVKKNPFLILKNKHFRSNWRFENKSFRLKLKLVHTFYQVPFQIASPLLTKVNCP